MAQPKILLASESKLKRGAIITFFEKNYPNIKPEIDCLNCDPCGLPPQPIACGTECAAIRMAYAVATYVKPFDMVMAIESDMEEINGVYIDCAHIRIMAGGIVGVGKSVQIPCPVSVSELESQEEITVTDRIRGYRVTGGDILHHKSGVNSKNWMLDMGAGDRVDQIAGAIKTAMNDLILNITNCHRIKSGYKFYDDFPKPGVKFGFFYSLFVGSSNTSQLADIISRKYAGCEVDAVIPLESRGLVLGALAADRLKASMIPMQKPGKIPGEKVTIQYGKEYGTDEIQFSVELLEDFLTNKKRCYHFLICDDLIATGGSIRAALSLLDKLAIKYGFRYKTTVFALEDVAPLRAIAKAAIGCQCDILFHNIATTHQRLRDYTAL